MNTSKTEKLEIIDKRVVLILTIWAITVSLLSYWGWFSRLPVYDIAFLVMTAIGIVLAIYYRKAFA